MIKNFLAALFAVLSLAAGSASAQPTTSPTLGKIKAAKAINVAYSADSLPFSVNGPSGAPVGYSIDLCKRVIAQIGRAVGEPELKVNWMPGSVAERLQMVACFDGSSTFGLPFPFWNSVGRWGGDISDIEVAPFQIRLKR